MKMRRNRAVPTRFFPDSIRMNLALPKSRLIEAMERLKKYVFI